MPILEVGERGSSEYFGMIESGAVSEFVAAAFDGGSPLRPANPRLETRMRLFMQCYAEGMQAGQTGLMMCSDEASAAAAYDKLCAGMVAANACLLKHGSSAEGSFLLGKDFSLAECLSAPFVIRARTALKVHRGVDIQADAQAMRLERLAQWLDAVAARPSVASTTPSPDYLSEVPSYLRARWFAYTIPGDVKAAIQAKALSADSTADERARQQVMLEGAKLAV